MIMMMMMIRSRRRIISFQSFIIIIYVLIKYRYILSRGSIVTSSTKGLLATSALSSNKKMMKFPEKEYEYSVEM